MKRAASLEPLQLESGRFRARLERLFAGCGVQIDGPNAWDIQVHHGKFFSRVLANGSLGLGESYFERSWARMAAKYDERFRRMWHYYLSASAAAFRARKLEVWQVLLEPA